MYRILAVTGITTAILAAGASARVMGTAYVGKVVDHPDSKVRFGLKQTTNGAPVELLDFRIRKLSPICKDGSTTERSSVTTPDGIKVFSDRRFKVRYKVDPERNPKSRFVIKGRVQKNALRVRGTVRSGYFPSRGGKCKIPKAKFKAKQRNGK